ncbi:hypothetical protein ACJMK2_019679 [Sinanodonta woodiana]|uniref:C2H2-type domain-containing protein n=1 Tax=Sinanodonta woodiana TaxID=1069815 RepID=A0ABD3TZA1_SINWO
MEQKQSFAVYSRTGDQEEKLCCQDELRELPEKVSQCRSSTRKKTRSPSTKKKTKYPVFKEKEQIEETQSSTSNLAASDDASHEQNGEAVYLQTQEIEGNLFIERAEFDKMLADSVSIGDKPFLCDFCNMKFAKKHYLSRHRKLHTQDKAYSCGFCTHAKFATAGNLKRHMLIHSGGKKYTCDVCNASFARSCHLSCHKRQHHKLLSKDAAQAGKVEHAHNKAGADDVTVNKMPENENEVTSAKPDGSFQKTCEIALERLIALGNKMSKSDKLSQNIKDSGIRSELTEDKSSDTTIICAVDDIPSHVETDSSANHNIPDKLKKEINDLAQNITRKTSECINSDSGRNFIMPAKRHIGEGLFECSICNARFKRRRYLVRHQIVHTGLKPYGCGTCGARFSNNRNMSRHMRTHTGEKPYKCDLCDARFSQKSNLKCHSLIHSGIKPYLCDKCGSRFSHPNDLRRHQETHLDEKLYVCDICDARFTSHRNCVRHKQVHTGERPHKCQTCGATFAQLVNLKSHEKLHEGDTPYRCVVCMAGFPRQGELTRHKKQHVQSSSDSTEEALDLSMMNIMYNV